MSGLNVTMLRLLDVVDTTPDATITQLAELLGIERSSMGRNVRVLVKKGFVRLSEGQDERSRTAQITETGRTALAVARPLWREAQSDVAQRLGAEKDSFLNLLGSLQEQDD